MLKGSICSGIGGLDAATPGTPLWVSEIDPAASAVLARANPPWVPNLGDITALRWQDVPRPDLIVSGDPCQSMSAAGLQRASEDERFLWPYVIEAIRTLHPKEVFLENVQNLTSVALVKGDPGPEGRRGSVLRMRLDDLRDAGYAARWTVLGACAVGAPHHRHRWFLRATFVGAGTPEAAHVKVACGASRSGGRVLLPTPTTADGTGGPGTSPLRAGGMNLRTAVTLLPTPVARDADGRGEGSPEYWAQRSTRRQNGASLGAAVNLLPTPRATDGTNGGPSQRGSGGDLAMGSACQPEVWGRYAEAVALWEHITGRPAPEPTEEGPKGGRRLNAALSEWMMGYPTGFITDHMGRNDALRCAGNGVVTRQAEAAYELLGGTS